MPEFLYHTSLSNNTTNKTWSGASDEEIVFLLAAADRGDIDTYNNLGWRVGDERQIELSAMPATGVNEVHAAQTITMVLLHQGLYVDTAGKEVNWIVGMKYNLAEPGYMNSSNTNSGSWESSKRRIWCNNIFYNALPDSIRLIFKKMTVKTAASYNGSSLQTTGDYFALLAAKEIFGGSSTGYSNLTEYNALTQFDYYKDPTHRIHINGGNNIDYSSSGNYWWERSPYYNSSYSFCIMNTDGGAGAHLADSSYGLCVFGCI
jgi:hypothetical protein